MSSRRLFLAASVSAILLLAAAAGAQQRTIKPAVRQFVSVDAPIVALTHIRLIDGTGAPAREDQTIVLKDGVIFSVGPSAGAVIPAGAQTIDLANHTVMPGQVGLHEHTYFGGVKRLTQMSVSGPYLYLASGITTGLTAGSQLPYHELNMQRAIDAGELAGPRFLIAGPYLNGGPPRNAMYSTVNTPAEAERVIAYWATEGATWIKYLGGETRDVLRAGIQAAHARGLKVTGHLCSVTFAEASDMGIDLLQHGFITNSDYVPGKQPDVCPAGNMRVQADVDVGSPQVQASIRAIVAHKTAVVSTLGVYEMFALESTLDPQALEMLDPDTRKEVEANHAGLAQSGFVVPQRLIRKMQAWERAFVAAGGLLGAGCDPWGNGFLPGIGNLRNYELLVGAGFAPEQAVQIMTLNGARILGMENRIGSIAPGKVADLVVIRGNPVASPHDIYNVVTVFKGGVGYDSGRLRAAAKGHVGVD
jgi:cytosine/adenosine deaminase-related metal-dependent hydrolase